MKKVLIFILLIVFTINISAKALSVVIQDGKLLGAYYTQSEMIDMYGEVFVFDEIVLVDNKSLYLNYNLGLDDGINYALLDEDSVNKCNISNKIVQNLDKFKLSCNCSTESKAQVNTITKHEISIKQTSDIKYLWYGLSLIGGIMLGYFGAKVLD